MGFWGTFCTRVGYFRRAMHCARDCVGFWLVDLAHRRHNGRRTMHSRGVLYGLLIEVLQMGGNSSSQALHSEEEKGESTREAEPPTPKSPFKVELERNEKAASSTGKRHGGKMGAPLYDSAENSPPPSARSR